MNKYTDEQLAIINSNEPVIIGEAVSGSGKSSTAIGFAEVRKDKKILYCVFNSSMKKEAECDFKHLPNVTVKTTHGLAYAKFGNKYKNKLLRGNYRVADVISDLRLGKKDFEFASQILEIYEYYLTSDFHSLDEAVDSRYKNDTTMKKNLIKYANKLWKKKEDVNSGVGIEHNFYLKLYHLSKPNLGDVYDVLIADESQDLNRLSINLIENATCKQKLVTGDSRQQIYSWNGAKNALNRIEGVRYALSNSFRVGQRTAEICNYIYKEFLNEDLDMKGLNENHNIYSHKSLDIHSKSGITVICRRNSTVLANALESAERGRRIYFIGGIRGYKLDLYRSAYYFMVTGKTKEPMLSKFSSWREMVECADETDDVELNTLINIVKTYNKKIPDGVEKIKEYTVNKMSEADIILTTAHKSKGLTIMGEGVVLEKDLINLCELKEAITSMAYSGDLENAMKYLESHREELNLLYVALTRSKTNLYLNDDIIQYLRGVKWS
jgi:hypothetical protein